MNLSEIVCSCAIVGSMLLSGCYYDDSYSQQSGVYGDSYGQQGNPQQDAYGQNQGGYANSDPYGQQGGGINQGYAESGDVVTLPGDGSSTDYSYGNSGYDSSSSTGGNSYGNTSSGGRSYTVKKGDNLFRVGIAHGVAMQEIMQANGLTDSTIYPGQELRIP